MGLKKSSLANTLFFPFHPPWAVQQTVIALPTRVSPFATTALGRHTMFRTSLFDGRLAVRLKRRYRIKDNTVSAAAFKAIAASLRPGERVENETPKGLRVSDKGFLNTAVIQSQITYIDGEAGVLRYRGYPIEQLALHSTHLETAYLLIYGTLPGEKQLKMFESEVMSHSYVHADAENFFRSFRCVLLPFFHIPGTDTEPLCGFGDV